MANQPTTTKPTAPQQVKPTVPNQKVSTAQAWLNRIKDDTALPGLMQEFERQTATGGYAAALKFAEHANFSDTTAADYRDRGPKEDPIEDAIRTLFDRLKPGEGFAAAEAIKLRLKATVNLSVDEYIRM